MNTDDFTFPLDLDSYKIDFSKLDIVKICANADTTRRDYEETLQGQVPDYYAQSCFHENFSHKCASYRGSGRRAHDIHLSYSGFAGGVRPIKELKIDEEKLTDGSPLVDDGDLSFVYGSKTKAIPEVLDKGAFAVTSGQPAELMDDDLQLVDGVTEMLHGFGDIKDTYFIVDVGHAHLPGIATLLAENDIECSFVIPGKINPRFQNTLKYWAKAFSEKKARLDKPVGYASMIDAHRDETFCEDHSSYELLPRDFPSAEKLKELGIKKVVYMNEGGVGKYSKVPDIHELSKLMKNYKKAGLEIEACGVDERHEREPLSFKWAQYNQGSSGAL